MSRYRLELELVVADRDAMEAFRRRLTKFQVDFHSRILKNSLGVKAIDEEASLKTTKPTFGELALQMQKDT